MESLQGLVHNTQGRNAKQLTFCFSDASSMSRHNKRVINIYEKVHKKSPSIEILKVLYIEN